MKRIICWLTRKHKWKEVAPSLFAVFVNGKKQIELPSFACLRCHKCGYQFEGLSTNGYHRVEIRFIKRKVRWL